MAAKTATTQGHAHAAVTVATGATPLIRDAASATGALSAVMPARPMITGEIVYAGWSMADVHAGVRGLSVEEALASKRIAEWLDSMEKYPETWGDPEALELQCLNLVEIRQMIVRPKALAANPYETRDAYVRFIACVLGEQTSTYLHVVLADHPGALDKLPTLLGDFGRWMAREYPPEVSTGGNGVAGGG